MFQSKKVIDGFSTVFRQEASAPIHCSMLHGYSISFEVTFAGELDHRQWVCDFGFMKRSQHSISWNVSNTETPLMKNFSVDEWFKHMFDHSVVVARNDSQLEWFKQGELNRTLNLRIVEYVGCERFAELVYNTLRDFIQKETDGRVHIVSVECKENGKNSALYLGSYLK